MGEVVDILCFGAHPDDVELGMAGTIYQEVQKGTRVGIIDLTEGELGSRGDEYTRKEEAARASEILGIHARENLGMADGFFEHSKENLMAIVTKIRQYRPSIVFCNAPSDRHPDHGKGSKLVQDACFLSGLLKIKTQHKGQDQKHWRPKRIFTYIQDHYIQPDFVVDITDSFDKRMEAIMAYNTQFLDNNKGPKTPISSEEFMIFMKGRLAEFGRRINVKYGEGFTSVNPLKVSNITDLL